MKQYHCYVCKKRKPSNQFFRDKTKSSGFGSRCKICNKGRGREYVRKKVRERDGHKCQDCGNVKKKRG